ncbi:SIR2 family protein [Alkalimarinus sediminis]|uniref:SIR2 family protein n=1 Tax=Alkalimarinus sediminis TaxID=1632866 RepID=A0A9E8HJ02_9ALTE|nr:SIR2 family protein [Alkalimarinus sediminis]UZW74232.1 SIR2 family protein [Alkalimarinus sediminis]
MTTTVHNPDQYMYDFQHVLTHSKKKIGILLGAGAPVSINIGGSGKWEPLIPDIAGLTKIVKSKLDDKKDIYAFNELEKTLSNSNIELILSRVRSLAEVIGEAEVHGLNAEGFNELSAKICKTIKEVVDKSLPDGENPYSHLISWINGINRDYAVEIFTTNYDLLLEEAMEKARTPYFDGFSGSKAAFFDPSSISSNDMPPRWIRLWKLHGSINWSKNFSNEVVRGDGASEGTMVYPSHIKYDQTQSAPFSSLFDRLKNFLLEPDSLLLTTGFSFADAHITAKLDECLSENKSAAIFAFQFKNLSDEAFATKAAIRRSNLSVYCKDGAVINGVEAKWKIGEEPSKNWKLIRAEYWEDDQFHLGDFVKFSKFLANSGGGKSSSTVSPPQNEGEQNE